MNRSPLPTNLAPVLALALGALLSWTAARAADIRSAPAAEVRAAAAAPRVALAAPAGARAHRIDLARPAAADAAAMKAYNAAATAGAGGKGQPLAIGYGRDVAAAARAVDLAALDWLPAPDGGKFARVEVSSPEAAAVRVALELPTAPPGLTFRFAGSAADAPVFGAIDAAAMAQETARSGLFWSPVLDGATATIELHAPAATVLDGVVLRIPRLSHHVVAGSDLVALSPKAVGDIGASGACNIDIACVTPLTTAVLDAAKSVVRISFVQNDGRSYMCTATLLGDSVQSQTPYVFSAQHCLNSPRAARTVNTYWFFDAASCNNRATPNYVQLARGAVLLGSSQDDDWAIVRLLDVPPAGARFAAWRAEALAIGATVVTIHHPQGDLKKWSQGKVTSVTPFDDGDVYGNYTEVVWSAGVTEGGSSGGPLLTLNASSGVYEVRGGLYAGLSACSAPHAPDYYSDLRTALPLMRQYLTPNAATPAGVTVAVEFYNAALQHYFLTTNAAEIANLDSGATIGWERTGARFLVNANPTAGTAPVCRFYRAPAYGDSHFYSADAAECAATAAAHPVDWVYESPNVFYAALPDARSGACPSGTQPVYRFFNRATTNHRYTTQVTVRNALATAYGWTAEGYGPGPYFPVMCAIAP